VDLHQVPAFLAAGYRVVTFDNRGVGATANAEDFTEATMVADTVELIETLDMCPVRLVAVSMGSYIAQELMLARPELVSQAALMATCGRQDRAREFFHTPEEDFANSAVRLPPTYDAKLRLLEGFSANTLNDEKAVQDWIDTFALWPRKSTPHLGAEVADALPNGRYLEIADTGHLGFLERPHAVNLAILDFFADGELVLASAALVRQP
jgi:pimeloyl-ACP methyl ester carboxylesterase